MRSSMRIARLGCLAVIVGCRDGVDSGVLRPVALSADVVPATGTERQITTDVSKQNDPAISGDRIVWQDFRSGNPDIYMFDLTSGIEWQITSDPDLQTAPAISGDRIVWEDLRNGNWDIYMFDLTSGTERQITTDPDEQMAPAISGDRIVWQDKRNGNWDIYMFDLATATERQITTDPSEQVGPVISGGRIVWGDDRNGYPSIYMFDLATGADRQITTAHAYPLAPAISGDRIVWEDFRNGTPDSFLYPNPDIYMVDLATGAEREITVDPGDQFYPAISGDWIVWEDYRNRNADIYMFDLATGGEQQIATDPVSFQGRPAISGDRIVWVDSRNGNLDIYMFQLSSAPLAITPPPSLTVAADPGRCDAQVDLGTATTSGGTPPIVIGASPLPPYAVGGSAPGTLPTVVTWTATDASGSTASATQVVIVKDQEAPLIGTVLNVTTTTDAGQPTASVNLRSPIASDNCPGSTIAGVRSDGLAIDAPYPVGQTQVTWTATDVSGNKSSAVVQTVTVVDQEPPVLDVPRDFTVNATSPSGAVVSYLAKAYDNVAIAAFQCYPSSGTIFPIGVVTVSCEAVDPSRNQATASFRVTVLDAKAQIGNLRTVVASLPLSSGVRTSLTTKLDAALAALNVGDTATACANLQDFINQVQAQRRRWKIPADVVNNLIADAQRIRTVLGC